MIIYTFIIFSGLLGWSRRPAYHYPWSHTCIQNQICGSGSCNQGQCICCFRVRTRLIFLLGHLNIFIAQIPHEYDQICITNIIQIKHNKLRTPTGGRLTSWLFSRCGGVEFQTPKTNPFSGRKEDLNPGPLDYKSSALPLGHARLP